jgi:hypothetical protein
MNLPNVIGMLWRSDPVDSLEFTRTVIRDDFQAFQATCAVVGAIKAMQT